MTRPAGLRSPGFRRFWWAFTASEFGSYLTSLAIAVLVNALPFRSDVPATVI